MSAVQNSAERAPAILSADAPSQALVDVPSSSGGFVGEPDVASTAAHALRKVCTASADLSSMMIQVHL
jgi:hypothetical protein